MNSNTSNTVSSTNKLEELLSSLSNDQRAELMFAFNAGESCRIKISDTHWLGVYIVDPLTIQTAGHWSYGSY